MQHVKLDTDDVLFLYGDLVRLDRINIPEF